MRIELAILDMDAVLLRLVQGNREIGPALVGIELGDPSTLPGLLERIDHSPIKAERVDPSSPFYRFML